MKQTKQETPEVKVTIETPKKMTGVWGWVDNFMLILDKHGLKNLLKGVSIIVVFLIIDITYNLVHNEKVVNMAVERMERKTKENHEHGAEVRKFVSPKVNQILFKLVYEAEADRAFVMEMHNGKENASSLPFIFYDMTYEEVREDAKIGFMEPQFENLSINNYPILEYIADHSSFSGNLEKLKTIDRRFASRLEEEGDSYCVITVIRSSGINIGFMAVTFQHEPSAEAAEMAHAKLEKYVQDVSSLLDLKEASDIKAKSYE